MSIVQWPDPRLSQPCAPVEPGESCRDLVDRMFAILEQSANGIGLAACQIGVMKRVVVVRVPQVHSGGTMYHKHALINPRIVTQLGQRENGWEGCLSFGDKQVLIPRFPRIQVDGYNLRWEPMRIGAKGLHARVWQHELQHLDGITIAHHARAAHEVEQERLARLKAEEQQLDMFSNEGGPGPQG